MSPVCHPSCEEDHSGELRPGSLAVPWLPPVKN